MTAYQPMITGNEHVVSSGHYLATQAAMDVLEAGGNAIDAGVAANLVLGVVQSEMVNIAGVAPIMVYLADSNQVLTLTGVGPWPKAASLDRFVQEFGEVPLGILRTVIPAAPDANIQALSRWGTMSFGEVASAAIRYAPDMVDPPQCMPDQYKVPDDAVKAYRDYYIGEKAGFAKWAYCSTPTWFTTGTTAQVRQYTGLTRGNFDDSSYATGGIR
jgi:gamma-glutamyltranspeptidase